MNEFGIGRVLGTGFKVWARNIVPFTLLSILIYSPVLIWSIGLASDPLGHLDSLRRFDMILGLFTLAGNIAIAAVLTYGVVMELQGSRASLGACVAKGISRLFAVLGVVILSMLAVIAGCIALIIPGIIVALMLYVATPVAVIEKTGAVESMKRSRHLTYGHKGQLFVIVIVLGAIGWVTKQIESSVLVPHDPAAALRALPMLIYVEIGTQIVLGALGAVMSAVAYYYLRLSKEGTSAQELASVFA